MFLNGLLIKPTLYFFICVETLIFAFVWFGSFYGISALGCYSIPDTKYIYIYIYIYEDPLISFQTFFRMGIFIDSTHMKLLSPSK